LRHGVTCVKAYFNYCLNEQLVDMIFGAPCLLAGW